MPASLTERFGQAHGARASTRGCAAAEIGACRICRETPRRAHPLPHEPRPVLRPSTTARICIASQAPGVRVHASGMPFTRSLRRPAARLAALTPAEFYDQRRVAIVPMGFCFPGHDAAGGDLPPRRECAPTWHERLFAAMPQLELILAVGSYAQRWHWGRGGAQHDGDGQALARAAGSAEPAASRRIAASLLAQQRLAHGQSLVRARAAAAPQRRSATAHLASGAS